ncbi:MAG: winged helix-turn-helix transcriptional regulator, partial [Brucella intermedia]
MVRHKVEREPDSGSAESVPATPSGIISGTLSGTLSGTPGPAMQQFAGPGANVNRGSNQIGVRAYNERLVLALVRRHGALARADIARLTGLSAQTVSVIIRALEK